MPDQDDPIDDEDELYRLIYPDFKRSDWTLSPQAYMLNKTADPEISVNVARDTTVEATLSASRLILESAKQVGGSPARFSPTSPTCIALKPGKGHHLGVIVARVPRGLGLRVERNPLPDNRSHALILGTSSRTQCSQLADTTTLTGHRASISA